MEASVAREIEAAVGEALALHGASGRVVARGKQVELHGHGAPVVIEVEHLGEQWPLLPQDMRDRKASDVARRLVQASRAVGSLAAPAPDAASGRPLRVIAIPASALVLLAIGLFFGMRYLRTERAPKPAPTTPTESAEEGAARRARVCEAARKRIYAGASMGPFDLEGWVAELWLATAPLGGAAPAPSAGAAPAPPPSAPAPPPGGAAGPAGSAAPAAAAAAPGAPPAVEAAKLGAFLADGKLTGVADAELAALDQAAVELAPGFSDEDAAASPGWRAVVVRFSGAYATAYFDPTQRARFAALADRMADAASADLGALYARCAHLGYHDAGAWFRGPDPAGAAAALVFGAGWFAELPAVNRSALGALGGRGHLDRIRALGATLDGPALARLVGAQGGSLAASPSGAAVLAFPVGGPTRATSASRIVARKLGIGVGED